MSTEFALELLTGALDDTATLLELAANELLLATTELLVITDELLVITEVLLDGVVDELLTARLELTVVAIEELDVLGDPPQPLIKAMASDAKKIGLFMAMP